MALTKDDVKGILVAEMRDAEASFNSELAEQRRMSIQYYYGKPLGNEVEGRSRVVMTDVAETIDWMLPSLIRMFLGGERVVRYVPKREDQEEGAKQATEYMNHVFLDECEGFQIMHDWFKSALIEKNGFVKPYYCDKSEPEKIESYKGLTEEEVYLLVFSGGGEDVEIVDWDEDLDSGLYSLRIRRKRSPGRIKIDLIPPEDFLICKRALTLDDDTPFSGHRRKMTKSDLIAMGFPKGQIMDLTPTDSPEYQPERWERHSLDETDYDTFQAGTDRADPASQTVWVTECYVRMDKDGDGYSELRRILVAGEGTNIEILEDEVCNRNPLCSITPIPIPHKFHGLSVADQCMDLQKIRSTVVRSILDNTYLQNNKRYAVVEGQVEIDDLLESRPGGAVRVMAPGMIEPLETPALSPGVYSVLEYLESERENRTGITRYNQGLDASSLNQTATGINSIMSSSHARVELIARIWASTGVKRLFKVMLREMIENNNKERVVRLRGEWVTVDPTKWSEDYDVEIEVGLGVGQANERIMQLMQILQIHQGIQAAGLGSLMVTPDNVYNTVAQIVEAMGFKQPGPFITDPAGQQVPEPPPDPKLLEEERKRMEAEARADQEQKKIQISAQHEESLSEFRVRELEAKTALEYAKLDLEERIAAGRAVLERTKILEAGNGEATAEETQ